jgi:hypothetical protein
MHSVGILDQLEWTTWMYYITSWMVAYVRGSILNETRIICFEESHFLGYYTVWLL